MAGGYIIINKIKSFFKSYWWAITTVLLIFLACLIPLIYFNVASSADILIATIYHKNDVIEIIDLKESDDRTFSISGDNGTLRVSISDHKIGIIQSNCPSQYCVNMGLIDTPNLPIICMYNGIVISIEGYNEDFDIAI